MPKIQYGDHFSREAGAKICAQWIAEEQLPQAILTTSYVLLEGVLDVLVQNPEQLAVTQLATFGDNRLLDFLPIRVNALPQQFPLIAEKALALTLSAINHQYKAGIHVVPRVLKVRADN